MPPVDKETSIILPELATTNVVMLTHDLPQCQIDGLAMSSQTVPPLSNIWLQKFESNIRDDAKLLKDTWTTFLGPDQEVDVTSQTGNIVKQNVFIEYRGIATDHFIKRLKSIGAPLQPVITVQNDNLSAILSAK